MDHSDIEARKAAAVEEHRAAWSAHEAALDPDPSATADLQLFLDGESMLILRLDEIKAEAAKLLPKLKARGRFDAHESMIWLAFQSVDAVALGCAASDVKSRIFGTETDGGEDIRDMICNAVGLGLTVLDQAPRDTFLRAIESGQLEATAIFAGERIPRKIQPYEVTGMEIENRSVGGIRGILTPILSHQEWDSAVAEYERTGCQNMDLLAQAEAAKAITVDRRDLERLVQSGDAPSAGRDFAPGFHSSQPELTTDQRAIFNAIKAFDWQSMRDAQVLDELNKRMGRRPSQRAWTTAKGILKQYPELAKTGK